MDRRHIVLSKDDHPLITVNDGTERVYREFKSVEEQRAFSEKEINASSIQHPSAPHVSSPIVEYDFPIDEKHMVLSSLWQPLPNNKISDESKARLKSFCKEQLDFSKLSEIFPDKTVKEININLYRGPKYYPSHGIPPDEEISVVNVEFSDGTSVKVKVAKEVKAKLTSVDSNSNTTTYTK